MRKSEYKEKYKELVRAGKIAEAKKMLQVYRETGNWEGSSSKTKSRKSKKK